MSKIYQQAVLAPVKEIIALFLLK